MTKRELELYIHIPFCERKCAYCDFLSFPSVEAERERYVEQLIQEIKSYRGNFDSYEVRSIFIGGGTPSILRGSLVVDIMVACGDTFTMKEDAEITIECNPGSVTEEKAKAWKEAGINRVSIGLQSTSNQELQELGRIHNYEDFLRTYQLLRSVGFHNINVDLISGIPGQTLEQYERSVQAICELDPQPEHISAYGLIVEQGTPYGDRYLDQEGNILNNFTSCEESSKAKVNQNGFEQNMPLPLPDEDTDQSMYDRTAELLSEYGYHRYEISNYALAGYECLHNVGYWQRVEYIGLGLGASSLIGNCRLKQTEDMQEYMDRDFCSGIHEIETMLQYNTIKSFEKLSQKDEIEEYIMLGLRMMKGISNTTCIETYGYSFMDECKNQILALQDMGLVNVDHEWLRLTEKGIRVSNYVIAEMLAV